MIAFDMWDLVVLLLVWFASGTVLGAALAAMFAELNREEHHDPPEGML